MPHDTNGRKIEKGDAIINTDYNGTQKVVSVVTHIYEGTDTCKVCSRSMEMGGYKEHTSTASETELILKKDGSKPE